MTSIIRATVVYLVLLILFRITGKRTLSDVTTFDFILLLIISESIQQGLIDNDNSLTNAVLLVVTLVSLNILFSFVKKRWPRADRVIDGLPVVILSRGKPLHEVMRKERVGEDDIMHAARAAHGLRTLDEVEFAILESSGGISVIPRRSAT